MRMAILVQMKEPAVTGIMVIYLLLMRVIRMQELICRMALTIITISGLQEWILYQFMLDKVILLNLLPEFYGIHLAFISLFQERMMIFQVFRMLGMKEFYPLFIP